MSNFNKIGDSNYNKNYPNDRDFDKYNKYNKYNINY